MLKQLFSHQNKEKHLKQTLSPRNKSRKFLKSILLLLLFFSFAPRLSPYSYVSNWNFLKIGNEFKYLMHTDMLK